MTPSPPHSAIAKTAPQKRKSVPYDLASLPGLPRQDLVAHWITAFKQQPPNGLSRRLLTYTLAYDLQVKAHGGLKPSVRRKIKHTVTASVNPSVAAPKKDPAAAPGSLSPGGRLVRDWHGTSHTVHVLEHSFLYDGRTYGSLSEIARTITGTRWSGPRFFGVQ